MLNLVGGVSSPVDNLGTGSTAATKRESEDKPVPQTTPQEDTVQISVSAKVQALNKDGQSVSAIANTLGLTTTEVKEYLNLTEDALKAALQAAVVQAAK